MTIQFEQAKELGISSPYAKGFMAYDTVGGQIQVDYAKTASMLAQDSATTTPNVGVPVAFLQYIDPQVVPILFSALNATKLASEMKKGDWADKFYTFPVEEYIGGVTPYSDFAENTSSDVNYEYPTRENFLFESVIKYGELEEANASKAKIALASAKQRSVAYVLGNAHNKFYMKGVKGKKSYGLLNDPNLAESKSPISITISGASYSTWTDKQSHDGENFANHVVNDINKLWTAITGANGGQVNANMRIILGISNTRAPLLGVPNKFGLSAKAMLKDSFPNLEIVEVPELTTSGGEMLYMIVPELQGTKTAECAYSEKMRMGRVVPMLSSYKQKAVGGTWGAIIKRPSLIQTMLGI